MDKVKDNEELVEEINAILKEEELLLEDFQIGDYIYVDINDETGIKTSGPITKDKIEQHQSVFKCVEKQGRTAFFKCIKYRNNKINNDKLYPKTSGGELQNFYSNKTNKKTITDLEHWIGGHVPGDGIKIGKFTLVSWHVNPKFVYGEDTVKTNTAIGSWFHNNKDKFTQEDIEKINTFKTEKDFIEFHNIKLKTRHISEDDQQHMERMQEIFKQKIYKINKKSKTISFPILNIENEKLKDEDIKRIKEIENDCNERFDIAYNKLNEENFGEDDGVEGISEGLPEELQNSEKTLREWKLQEQNTAQAINSTFNDTYNKNKKLKHRFYAINVGGGARSDILVVRDNMEFNNNDKENHIATKNTVLKKTDVDKLKPKDEDVFFFVETKLNYETASYFKFHLSMIRSGDKIEFKHPKSQQNYQVPKFTGVSEELSETITSLFEKDQSLNDEEQNLSKNLSNLISKLSKLKGINEDIRKELKDIKVFPEGFRTIAHVFNYFMTEWANKYMTLKSNYMRSMLFGKEKDAANILKEANVINRKLKELGGKNYIVDILSGKNKSYFEKFKRIFNRMITNIGDDNTTTILNLKNYKNPHMIKLIYDYMRDYMAVRYVLVGQDLYTIGTGNNKRGMYGNAKIAEKFPLGKTVDVIGDFYEKLKNNTINVSINVGYNSTNDKEVIQLHVFINNPKGEKINTKAVGTSEIKNIFDIDTRGTTDFLSNKETSKKSKHQKELEECINEILNESIEDDLEIEEGLETEKTQSNKYELKVTEAVNDFLKSQKSPYNTLSVEHYEGSDSKYWSDISVTNPKNSKRFWIEAKEDKYACLGSMSWKYKEGKWTCTTLEDNNPLLPEMLKDLEDNSGKFIQFCKDYLGKEDITLPRDLTDELVYAWRDSGSIQDTENDVLFITEKIPMDDFGSKIASFYKFSKNEPAYYIHVGDELYLIDGKTNVLGLRTKDGKPLKTLSEVYRIGRIQFRLKGYDRPQKHYWSVYTDIKILSDKENLDENYNCSFLDPEKQPVIDDGNSEVPTDKTKELQADTEDEKEIEEQFEDICNEEELDEYKKEFHLKDKEHTYKPEKNKYAFKNKSEKYGGDDYITSLDVVDRIDHNLHSKFGPENWFRGPDRIENKNSKITVEIDDGKDTRLNIKELVKSKTKGRVIYIVPTSEKGMTTDEVANQITNMSDFLGSLKPYYLVIMNENDESTYVCNGIRAEGNDIVLEFEWGDLMDYSKELDESSYSNDNNEQINKDDREYAYHVSNVSPETIKKDGFKSGLGNGGTDTNLFDDLYKEDYPKNYLFISKEPWDDKRDIKFKYAYKIDITDLDLYPDFGMLLDNGAYYDENYNDGGYEFWWKDRDLESMENKKLKELIEKQNGSINVNEMMGGETVEGDYFPEALYDALGSAVIDGDKVNMENRIVDVITRNDIKEAEQYIGGEKSDIADEFHGDKIWIDDIREAPEGFKWFHTVREFIEYVDEHGTDNIELIDTDHDAGDYQKFGGDYIRCFDYLDFIGAKNIIIHIHSANPVGANNIRRIISKNKEENGWREVRNTSK